MHALTNRLNPFPGLRPFGMEEKYLFFGREDQTVELLQRLRGNRFLAVVGTSGSGKSSLVRAGLLPELHGGAMSQAGSSWEVAILKPGGTPITNLAQALIDADLYDPEQEDILSLVTATLNRGELGLAEAARRSELPAASNLLIVVDQFEEIFRFRQSGVAEQEQAGAFVQLLLHAVKEPEQRIYVLLTMRSDYIGDCAQFMGLAEAINQGEYLIPRLSREQMKAAIEGPIKVGGADISPNVLQKLLRDVGNDQDQLPILQHCLMRMWDFWAADQNENGPLDIRHYETVGGMREALSRHADEVFEALANDRLRAIAGMLFKALTEQGGDNRGIRRPTRLKQLVEIVGAKEAEMVFVIDEFRKTGRTFLMPSAPQTISPETVIDISHESLMRVWRRLEQWVEEEAQSARVYRRLAESAHLHQQGQAGLLRDPDLHIAASWRENESPNEAWACRYHPGFGEAIEFLEASQKARDDEWEAQEQALQIERREVEQSRKNLVSFIACTIVVALAFLVVAVIFWQISLSAKSQLQEERAGDWFMLAEQRANSGDFVLALAAIDEALELQPELGNYLVLKVSLLGKMGRFQEADSITKSIDLSRARQIPREQGEGSFWHKLAEKQASSTNAAPAMAAIERALELKPKRAEFWSFKAGLLEKMGEPEAALKGYSKAFEFAVPSRSRSEYLNHWSRLLLNLGRFEEVARLNLEFRGIPKRPEHVKPELIDLSPYYNATLANTGLRQLETFGIKELELVNLEFDVRGAVHLNTRENWSKELHKSVVEIKVGRQCQQIHFLHSTKWGGNTVETRVGIYVIHYEDSKTETQEIKLGEHVRDWEYEPGPDGLPERRPTDSNAHVAWTGVDPRSGRQIQLFTLTWTNPRVGMAVESIDFISAINRTTPFLIAISVE